MEKNPFDLITILGHTAGGKTAFAANLAFGVGGEIISADSRQVYRGMDIGTGKDYADYLVEDVRIPVHLVDLMDAGYEYNVYLFKHDFLGLYGYFRPESNPHSLWRNRALHRIRTAKLQND